MSRSPLASPIHLEGALFSRDFLARLGSPTPDSTWLQLAAYRVETPRELREAISASWNVLIGKWRRFQSEREKLPQGDAATGLTRQLWLLPVLEELGYGRVQGAKPIRVTLNEETRDYPISHGWYRTPLHLLGAGVELDKHAPGVVGAARTAPHALLQEALNRSGEHLWGIVSNGLRWRVLRDSAALARLSYLEFDLEAIFEGDNTADFALFWMLCHASRFEWRLERVEDLESPDEAAPVEPQAKPPIIEDWLQGAHADGARVREKLRLGVKDAIGLLATGLLSHPGNIALRENLYSKKLHKQDFYRLSLRVVYRILFLLVAEAKDALLLPPIDGATPAAKTRSEARARYETHYSMAALRSRASRSRGTAHGDAWQGLEQTFRFFRADEPGMEDGLPALAIPALGGFLFDKTVLDECELENQALFAAMRALCFFQDKGTRRPVNFNLGSEELGSVYESLLELVPDPDLDARSFVLDVVAGNEKKTTGSYYTPEGLVKSLLDSALEPLLDSAARAGEAAILALRVCDPACGSGHFLTAAARRIADRLARLRSGGDEPIIAEVRRARREVIGKCIFGIDINPMATELCKIALWMEAIEPGKPLGFLDAHIRAGNSLLGATPQMVDAGLPDEAFAPLEGDDRAVVAQLKKDNRSEREQPRLGFDLPLELGDLRVWVAKLEAMPELTLQSVREKESQWHDYEENGGLKQTRLLYDAWCAAFVAPKTSETRNACPTTQTLFDIRQNGATSIPMQLEIERLAAQYAWFHPHLEFPQVFDGDSNGGGEHGFDLIIGNPPWERLKLQEKEWFASRVPEIALAANASERGKLIKALVQEHPEMHAAFLMARRGAEGESHFARKSGRYPLCGRGDVNTYALFAELNRSLLSDVGRVGCILPSGIATDDTTKDFFASCVNSGALVSLFDFENREKLFPAVDSRFKFCLLTLSGDSDMARRTQFVFFALRPDQTDEAARVFELTPDEIALLNPNTRTCPIFRSSRDAELTKSIYRRVPVFVNESKGVTGNPWGVQIGRMFHTSDDSPLFVEEETESTLRLYEAKCYWHFDHRYATWDTEARDYREVKEAEKKQPDFQVKFRYNIEHERVPGKFKRRLASWYLSFRKITNATNERTLVTAFTPESGLLDSGNNIYMDNAAWATSLIACLNSFAVDYCARQKTGGSNMTVGVLSQLPVLAPETYAQTAPWTGGQTLESWLGARVLELVYTARDLTPLARELGFEGEPFEWDTARRFDLRCELDAAFFHLYGLSRDEAAYVLETFPIVRRHDERDHGGQFVTRDRVLVHFDALSAARNGASG